MRFSSRVLRFGRLASVPPADLTFGAAMGAVLAPESSSTGFNVPFFAAPVKLALPYRRS